ncbi:MAG: high-potential iron-sulfur protein [Bacteriovoracales bacterium]|nr:high-potential iron-sulfur protein [Bacteriovoracales bacterium]
MKTNEDHRIGRNRRHFLQSTLFALGSLPLSSKLFASLLNTAWATDSLDSKVTRQGYTTTLPPKKALDKKKYTQHSAKVGKIKAGLKPNCKNCKHYKPVKAHPGWGKCTMVGATGKEGKLVSENGWCKVWLINKKAV